MFRKENKYEHIFYPTCVSPCQYFDEDEFISKIEREKNSSMFSPFTLEAKTRGRNATLFEKS